MQSLAGFISRNFMRVLAYPFNPGERLFVLYLTTSLLMAIVVWRYVARRSRVRMPFPCRCSEFLFPSSIWRTASAWLDVRYFFFHQILRVFLYTSFTLMVSGWTFKTAGGLFGITEDSKAGGEQPFAWLVAIGYGFVSVALLDLVAYILHYCQHRFPLLWEFHKVHHSARVMHPLTNYREHPIDNVVYAAGLGACTGFVTASVSAVLGYVPSEPTVLGVGIFVLAYNGLGYNLRHSHIWLKWPGPLVYLFGVPPIIRFITATIRHTSTRISHSCFRCGTCCSAPSRCPDQCRREVRPERTRGRGVHVLPRAVPAAVPQCRQVVHAGTFADDCGRAASVPKRHDRPATGGVQPETHGRFQRLSTDEDSMPRRMSTW